jgi:hypothetical protein
LPPPLKPDRIKAQYRQTFSSIKRTIDLGEESIPRDLNHCTQLEMLDFGGLQDDLRVAATDNRHP